MFNSVLAARIQFSNFKLNGQLSSDEAVNFFYDNVFMLSRSISEDRQSLVNCPNLFQDEPILAKCWEDGQVSWANSQL